jgi:hypothetical protein
MPLAEKMRSLRVFGAIVGAGGPPAPDAAGVAAPLLAAAAAAGVAAPPVAAEAAAAGDAAGDAVSGRFKKRILHQQGAAQLHKPGSSSGVHDEPGGRSNVDRRIKVSHESASWPFSVPSGPMIGTVVDFVRTSPVLMSALPRTTIISQLSMSCVGPQPPKRFAPTGQLVSVLT